MPTHLVTRINLDLLYPPFRDRVLTLLGNLHDSGKDYYITYGYRTFTEQNKLYAQGRLTPGPQVTKAQGGFSMHNYGIAIDVVFDLDPKKVGLQPSWTEKEYRPLFDEGDKLGLQVGVPNMSDFGHVQLPVREILHEPEGAFLSRLKKVYSAVTGPPETHLKPVWELLDQTKWFR